MFAEQQLAFATSLQTSYRIGSVMDLVKPYVRIEVKELDADPFLYNTKSWTFDLRRGLDSRRMHDPADYMTKSAIIDPGEQGRELWLGFLHQIHRGDQDVIDYTQLLAGTFAFGKIFLEGMTFIYGPGNNGKSACWNAIGGVQGSYTSRLSSGIFLAGKYGINVKNELAETRGTRLALTGEFEQNTVLNHSNLKQITSTDDILVEKKYRDPFIVTPSASIVAYTNFLPRLASFDRGTLRRIKILPHYAEIPAKDDVKRYHEYLIEHAGPYILQWILEGAQKAYALGFKFEEPKCVAQAFAEYTESNDWFTGFLDDCCEIGNGFKASSQELVERFMLWCHVNGECDKSPNDLHLALREKGFQRKSDGKRRGYAGLRIRENH